MTETTGSEAGLGSLEIVGIVAATVSAAIQVLLGVRLAPSGFGISLLLAGGGFVGAIGLVAIGYRRRTVYAVGIPFVAVQMVLWFALNFVAGPKSFPWDVGALGAVDKVAQGVLLGTLVVLLRSGA